MSEKTYTPWPWYWTERYPTVDDRKTWSLMGPDHYGILSCDGEANSPQGQPVVGEANARLIAAAPALLEALTELLNAPYRLDALCGGSEQMAACEKARRAITAATGEPS